MVQRIRITEKVKKPRGFVKGMEKRGGRAPGTPNKVSVLLKDALIKAAEAEGLDRKGKDGLIGFLRMLSRREPAVYGRLLEKLLPYQLTGKDGGPMQLQHTTKQQVVERLKERGLPVPQSLMATPEYKPPGETSH